MSIKSIKLANETALNVLEVIGDSRFVQGASREAVTFVFPAEASLDELDSIFTAENCEKISIFETVIEDGKEITNEYIHTNYAIRVELKREPVEVAPATDTAEAVFENRVMVTMAQRTYTETRMAYLEAQIAKIVG